MSIAKEGLLRDLGLALALLGLVLRLSLVECYELSLRFRFGISICLAIGYRVKKNFEL